MGEQCLTYSFNITQHSPTLLRHHSPNVHKWGLKMALIYFFFSGSSTCPQDPQLWLPNARGRLPIDYLTRSSAVFRTKLHPPSDFFGGEARTKVLWCGRRATRGVMNNLKQCDSKCPQSCLMETVLVERKSPSRAASKKMIRLNNPQEFQWKSTQTR